MLEVTLDIHAELSLNTSAHCPEDLKSP